jgi:hypothetical protein
MKTELIDNFLPHGTVEVPPKFKNPRGENVNKYRVRYKFVIGEDTMQLIGELNKLNKEATKWYPKGCSNSS